MPFSVLESSIYYLIPRMEKPPLGENGKAKGLCMRLEVMGSLPHRLSRSFVSDMQFSPNYPSILSASTEMAARDKSIIIRNEQGSISHCNGLFRWNLIFVEVFCQIAF